MEALPKGCRKEGATVRKGSGIESPGGMVSELSGYQLVSPQSLLLSTVAQAAQVRHDCALEKNDSHDSS